MFLFLVVTTPPLTKKFNYSATFKRGVKKRRYPVAVVVLIFSLLLLPLAIAPPPPPPPVPEDFGSSSPEEVTPAAEPSEEDADALSLGEVARSPSLEKRVEELEKKMKELERSRTGFSLVETFLLVSNLVTLALVLYLLLRRRPSQM